MLLVEISGINYEMSDDLETSALINTKRESYEIKALSHIAEPR
jgi:hypothetical protein